MAETKKPILKTMTPKGIAKFPNLNKADTKFNAEGEFKVGVILPATACGTEGPYKGRPYMEVLQELSEEAFNEAKAKLEEDIKTLKGEKLAKAKKALAELKIGDLPAKPVYDEDGNETGDISLTFKMKAQRTDKKTGKPIKMVPKVFDASGKPLKLFDSRMDPIPNAPQIWGGSVIKIAGSFNPFYIPGTNTCGVGLRLAAVQVLELRSGDGGNAESYGFGKEDGYEAPQSEGEAEGFQNEGDASDDEEEDF